MMRAAVCIVLLPLGVVACTFTMGVHRESKPVTATSPAPVRQDDRVLALVAEYEAELDRNCDLRLIAAETCAEQRRLVFALRQAVDRAAAYRALADHAGEVEHPAARRPLLAILARLRDAMQQ
jgi:hypothetical protein